MQWSGLPCFWGRWPASIIQHAGCLYVDHTHHSPLRYTLRYSGSQIKEIWLSAIPAPLYLLACPPSGHALGSLTPCACVEFAARSVMGVWGLGSGVWGWGIRVFFFFRVWGRASCVAGSRTPCPNPVSPSLMPQSNEPVTRAPAAPAVLGAA